MLDRLIADQVASRGRNGDSVLVHMAPEEIGGLQALAQAHGTSMTINPYTGYPEAFKLKNVVKSVTKAVGNVLKPVAKVLKPLAPIIPFLPIPGIGPLSSVAVKSILGGALGGMGKDGKFNLKRALAAGALQYGLSSLAQGAGNASPTGAPPTGTMSLQNITPPPGATFEASLGQYVDTAGNVITDLPGVGALPSGAQIISQPGLGDVVSLPKAAPTVGGFQSSLPEGAGFMDYVKQTGSNIMEAGKGIGNLVTNPAEAFKGFKAGLPINPFTNAPISPTTAGMAVLGGLSAVKTLDELEAMKNQAQQILDNPVAANREEDIEWAKGVLRDYPIRYEALSAEDVKKYGFAGGGIASLGFAKGGQPRFLSGGGDGMSDSIPATIANRQPARLADGEFVVPADVVSHIGNGSSKAGAKKLYAMMDRVRKARTGKKRQAPAVRAERYMPA